MQDKKSVGLEIWQVE